MATLKMLATASVSVVLAVTSIAAVAGTSSNSPFATKKKKAWETQQPTDQAPPQTPNWPQEGGQYQTDSTATPPTNTYSPQPIYNGAPTGGGHYQMPSTNYQGSTQAAPQYYNAPQQQNQTQAPSQYPSRNPSQYQGQQNPPLKYAPAYSGQTPTNSRVQTYNQAPRLRGPSNPSMGDRFGFGNLQTNFSGSATLGAAAVDTDTPGFTVKAETIFDIDARGEISAITDAGTEYGAGVRVRAQRDRLRRGFGGRVGDCPAGNPACTSTLVGGVARGVKGHTGQFYTAGAPDTEETALGLEGAYLFLRTSYGDFVAGRDDGAAYLFSLGAPSLVAVGASNSGVDYTGLDSVKTFNDPSGYAEKIAYTSPRLLGDRIGVGVQVGVSYAPDAKACGVNYCVRDNSPLASEVFAPEIKNIVELGVSLDRKFNNGMSAEFTTTYARGSENTGNAAFTNLSTWGAGLELKYADFVFGTSYLKSNNGFAGNGDYTAYDVGLTWKPSNWGYSASYGHATDDIAQLSSNQGVLAISYDFGKFRLGSGVQYISRNTPLNTLGGVVSQSQDATALFIEGGIKF